MNIGILGAGNVGLALSKGLVHAGHHVLISSRDPKNSKYFAWKHDVGNNGDITTFNIAAQLAEIIIVALPWSCLKEVLEKIDPAHLKNKTIIDVSNAVQFDNAPRLLFDSTSAGELIQGLLPDSYVVKTLNTISDKKMVHPNFIEGMPTMFISGNEIHSKNQVKSLLNDLGWIDIVDLGDIRQSRLQESIMLVCVISEIQLQSPDSAFALLKH
ncbi:NADPH-dependent F420 reductase [Paenibacillus sp. FSL H7-0331]|uniref:NADPH-dependent F420 reductase n=1 Tax=Paenibacillus sp. FSL H7-0331 TaxID=1920421 RepID=UPI00096E953B|nr:NAD(P)-binding domain-containing protein [Paenibacillus sp. FSL H7-0331]OME98706.1 hypothetical protein BK127_39660 [Paenibacillus sp. FSL H7-0331]